MKPVAPIALVTDALWRKSLCAIRALGAAGYRVFALGDSWFTPGFHSRYTERHFRGPTAADDPAGFGATLVRAIAATEGAPAVLLPMEDATCAWLLRHGPSLPSHVRWLLPPESSFAIARDKARTATLAAQLGIDVPRTFAPGSADELREMIAAHDARDFVLKPRTGSGASGLVYGADILTTALDSHWQTHGPLLLQERIPAAGAAFGVSFLFDRSGGERAVFAHRRLRQYPVSGGASTQRIGVMPDALHEPSRRLLTALSWSGVAMVEWKIHPRTGRPLLLEINPRFWGSLALAVRSGVDFPTLCADAALDRPLPPAVPTYRPGVVCRWTFPGDILRYLAEPSALREPPGAWLKGAIHESEEFDRHDLRGSIASVAGPALLAANPKYWRYLRRGSRAQK